MIKKIILPLALLAILALTMHGCGTRIRAEGDPVSHNMTVTNFNSIHVGGLFTVNFTQSNQATARIVVQENIFEFIEFGVSNNTLTIDIRRGVSINFNGVAPRVYLTGPQLTTINASGLAIVTALSNETTVNITASGSSIVWASGLIAQNAHVNASGNAQVYVHASHLLAGSATGNARVRHNRNTTTVSVTTSGNATVQSHGD